MLGSEPTYQSKWRRGVLTIPPSGIILTMTALQVPVLAFWPNLKICLELGPRGTTGRISCHRGSLGLSLSGPAFLVDFPSTRPLAAGVWSSCKAKICDSGHSLPEKCEVSISTCERCVKGVASRTITLNISATLHIKLTSQTLGCACGSPKRRTTLRSVRTALSSTQTASAGQLP